MSNPGETNWYECDGCGEVIDPADVREDPLPVLPRQQAIGVEFV